MREDVKKIAILLPFFRDGGVERIMLNLSDEMLLIGKKVDFVFITNSRGLMASKISVDCHIFELQKKGPISALFAFWGYIKREKPDVILSALTPANLLAIWAKILFSRKTKVIIGVQVAVATSKSTSFFKSIFRPIIYRIFFRFADKIVAVSRGIKKDLENFGVPAKKIEVIYNPVFSLKVRSMGEEPVSHPWFADHSISIILGVGRLHKQKDFPLLIRAFSKILLKKKAKLLILGEGEERKNLENLIKELGLENDVQLFGFVDNPFSYMKNSSVFVLSSAWEGFGNVLAEAMSFGVPVVSTDCPWGPREILEDGKYGKLVPVGDEDGLSEAIFNALDMKNNKEAQILGAGRFNVKTVLNQYLDLFV